MAAEADIQHIEMSDFQYQDSSQSYRYYIEGRYLAFFLDLDVVCSMCVQLYFIII